MQINIIKSMSFGYFLDFVSYLTYSAVSGAVGFRPRFISSYRERASTFIPIPSTPSCSSPCEIDSTLSYTLFTLSACLHGPNCLLYCCILSDVPVKHTSYYFSYMHMCIYWCIGITHTYKKWVQTFALARARAYINAFLYSLIRHCVLKYSGIKGI